MILSPATAKISFRWRLRFVAARIGCTAIPDSWSLIAPGGCNLRAERARGHTMVALLWSVATGLASKAVEFRCGRTSDCLRARRVVGEAVLRMASNRRRPNRGSAPLPHRPRHAGTARLGPMTARICRGSDSHGVPLGRVAVVLERCETGEPVIDRPSRDRPSRVVLGAGVVAVSSLCGYADRHGRGMWLRGRSRGVRP
jgi:hypothetical protein